MVDPPLGKKGLMLFFGVLPARAIRYPSPVPSWITVYTKLPEPPAVVGFRQMGQLHGPGRSLYKPGHVRDAMRDADDPSVRGAAAVALSVDSSRTGRTASGDGRRNSADSEAAPLFQGLVVQSRGFVF